MPKYPQTSQQTKDSGENRSGMASAAPNHPRRQAALAAEVSSTHPHATAASRSSPLPHPSSLFTSPSSLRPKRLAQIAILLLTTLTMLGAGAPSNRFDKIGHKLMCTCSCGEILLECNHVGCPTSGPMIDELNTHLAAGMPDHAIFDWFASKYGAIVLASPMRGGFDIVAWVMPFAVLALGIVAAVWLTRHWHDRHNQAALANSGGLPLPPPSPDLRDRIRRDTTYDS